mmetsp:Transcript_24769/g.65464  ORF Transcript_24769/g.65464 Transcript_24769/m.65464 type:complete len:90 (+) Transcript_24769:388-657(+)
MPPTLSPRGEGVGGTIIGVDGATVGPSEVLVRRPRPVFRGDVPGGCAGAAFMSAWKVTLSPEVRASRWFLPSSFGSDDVRTALGDGVEG